MIGQFEPVGSGIETATNSVQQAYTYSQQAEIDSLTGVIGAVFDNLGGARQALDDCRTKSEAYRQLVEGVSAGN